MSGPPLNGLQAGRPCAAWWGKLPSQGDFVGRRLPHALTARWDEWLRNGMDQLRSDASDTWSTRFVQSPLWFFLCPASIMGQPLVGVMGPSADRIGRLFPLAIMATTEDAADMPATDEDLARFLGGARQALIDARRLPLSAQQLDERLLGLHWPFRTAGKPVHGLPGPDAPGGLPLFGGLLPAPDGGMPMEGAPMGGPAGHGAGLPRMDWRSCMRPGSSASVWWISPTPQHAHDEVVQHEVLHRRLFTRLFKGA
jgi:type VI secretion system protein ImpM